MKLIAIVGDSPYGTMLENRMDQMTGRVKVVARLGDEYRHKFIERGMIYGPVSEVYPLVTFGVKVVLAAKDDQERKALAERLGLYKWSYATLIHKGAHVASDVTIGKGTLIMDKVTVESGAKIGSHVRLCEESRVKGQTAVRDFTTVHAEGKPSSDALPYAAGEAWTSA